MSTQGKSSATSAAEKTPPGDVIRGRQGSRVGIGSQIRGGEERAGERGAAREIGEGEEDGAGGDLLRDDLRGVPLLAVHGQGPRLDRPSPGREERKDGKGAGDKENAGRVTGPS